MFITDNTSDVYQTLIDLVALRNKVAHSKDFYTSTEVDFQPAEDSMQSFTFPYELVGKLEPEALGVTPEQCKKVVRCLRHLDSVLSFEVELSESELFKAL